MFCRLSYLTPNFLNKLSNRRLKALNSIMLIFATSNASNFQLFPKYLCKVIAESAARFSHSPIINYTCIFLTQTLLVNMTVMHV